MTPHFFGNFWTTLIFGPDRPISRADDVTRVRDVLTHYHQVSFLKGNLEWLVPLLEGHSLLKGEGVEGLGALKKPTLPPICFFLLTMLGIG